MERVILARYGEIHLKGLNRPYFEGKLVEGLRNASRRFGAHLEHGQGRFYLSGYRQEEEEALMAALCRVFGVHSVSPSFVVDSDFDSIAQAAVDLAREQQGSFKVEARRGDKHFPMKSPELAAELGARVLEALPELKVDIHEPLWRLNVEVREKTYLYVRTIKGPGGMPTGSAGRTMLMLSGGIDSPVAGYMLARRGVELEAVYFHSPPHTSLRAKQKVEQLVEKLSEYCGGIRLHCVHFTNIQETIYQTCDIGYMTVIMRRFMMRIAQKLAEQRGCLSMLSGENLGQVASQTMAAIVVTNAVAEMPVFRPLIAYDKQEIIEKAIDIGTYDISILPYEDCCTIFVPKHPVTKPRLRDVLKEESKLAVDELVEQALAQVETQMIGGRETARQ